jgi:hypothetical protein
MHPYEWNIIVAGDWNRAILTPNWIARSLFALPPSTPVDVLVALDGSGPFQVRYGPLTVIPLPGQLLVQLAEPSAEQLEIGLAAMIRAIQQLPRTPLRACGINLRFRTSERPSRLLDQTRTPSEKALSDAGFKILSRRRGEVLAHQSGTLNVVIDVPTDGDLLLTFNFDRQSEDANELLAWLKMPATELAETADRVLALLTDSEMKE